MKKTARLFLWTALLALCLLHEGFFVYGVQAAMKAAGWVQ